MKYKDLIENIWFSSKWSECLYPFYRYQSREGNIPCLYKYVYVKYQTVPFVLSLSKYGLTVHSNLSKFHNKKIEAKFFEKESGFNELRKLLR